MEFMGYVRPDGKVGARNYVAVIPSVTCANDVANARYRVPLHICTIRVAARCPLIWSA